MKYLFLLTFLLGCNGIDCPYDFVSHGITFCMNEQRDVDTNQIEQLLVEMERAVKIYYDIKDFRKVMAGQTVRIFDMELYDPCLPAPNSSYYICTGKFAGYNSVEAGYIGVDKLVSGPTCFLDNTLAHELLHTVSYRYFGSIAHGVGHMFIQNYPTHEEKIKTIEYLLTTRLQELRAESEKCQ